VNPLSSSSRRRAVRRLLFVAYNLFIAAALAESIILVMLHAPSLTARSPRPFRRLIQQVYRHFNRSLIQFDRDCARYDPAITYTLKPGTCTFENLEFKNVYRINRVGVRDDEVALDKPEVIVLGDSHAMGWGVDQDESLPRVVARQTRLKVLNAAVSSYGTVREMMMLDRLDTSRLRTLVLQYSDNDVVENRTFQQEHGHLPILPEPQYEQIVRHYQSQRLYYPGKYLFRLFMKVTRLEEPEPDQARMEPLSAAKEAELFLNAMMHASHTPLDAVQILVFEVNEQIRPARPFIAALESVKTRSDNPPYIRRLKTLDIAPLLTPDDFYVLDDHMNRRGHEKVATAIAQALP
jgi:hypothetical protein